MYNKFSKTSGREIRKMSLQELAEYQIALRKYEFEHHVSLKHIRLRKIIHPLCLLLVKIDRLSSGEKVSITGDARTKPNYTPRIYACTHIGGNDIQRTFEAIGDHAYLFLGDPKDLYRDAAGMLLKANGVICCETSNKQDRQIAYLRAVELLQKGGNLLIYPEGVWNTTANLPVRKLYPGTVKMAQETGAEIIPMALEQYGEQFVVNIGKGFCVAPQDDLQAANQTLRDAMATLKYTIWESIPKVKRCTFPQGYEAMFQQEIIQRCDYEFSAEEVEQTVFRDKNITTAEEAFAHLDRLIPCRENAFLLRKQNMY